MSNPAETTLDPLPGRDPARTTVDGPDPARTTVDAPDPTRTTLDEPAEPFVHHNLPKGLARQYRLREQLGQGGEATVYLADDLINQREVVVKVFNFAPKYTFELGSPGHAAVFRPEHSVQIFERAEEAGMHVEVMEYCPHGTLADLAGGEPLPAPLLLEVIREAAMAIDSMHPTVHGDVKPSNVLVRTLHPLDLVLTDFGLTRDLGGRSHVSNTGRGTLAYLPPGGADVTRPADDWWAFGMMIAELAAGRHPFQHADGTWVRDNLIKAHLSTKPVPVDQVADEDVRYLVRGLLVRDPDERWSWTQVSAWLEGERPPLGLDHWVGAQVPADRGPFEFEGRHYRDEGALGDALQASAEAKRVVQGQALKELEAWVGPAYKERVARVAAASSALGPVLAAALIAAILAPAHRPIYWGLDVASTEGVRAMVSDEGLLKDVYDKAVLRHFGSMLDVEQLSTVNHEWHEMVDAASRMIPMVAHDDAARNLVRVMGLQYAWASSEERGELAASIAQRAQAIIDRPGMGDIAWLKPLLGKRDFVSTVAIVAASPIAERDRVAALALLVGAAKQAVMNAELQVASLKEQFETVNPTHDAAWWTKSVLRNIRDKLMLTPVLVASVTFGWWVFGHWLVLVIHAPLPLARGMSQSELEARFLSVMAYPLNLVPMTWSWPPSWSWIWGWIWPTGMVTAFIALVICSTVRDYLGVKPKRMWPFWLLAFGALSNVWRTFDANWNMLGNYGWQRWMPLGLGGAYLLALYASKERRKKKEAANRLASLLSAARRDLQEKQSALAKLKM